MRLFTDASFEVTRSMYRRYIKRLLDFVLSLCGLIILSPLLMVLIVIGTIEMKGNPFFIQERPGLHERIIKVVKLRTMSNERDNEGNLLPDDVRLNRYGKWLRAWSLDELPELWCILKGDMSIIGPRPLLVKYLPLYNEEQHHRHDVRPGLTGYAQSHGRNTVTWEDKFKMDVWYTRNVSFRVDLSIFFRTVVAVLKREGINSESSATMEEFKGSGVTN